MNPLDPTSRRARRAVLALTPLVLLLPMLPAATAQAARAPAPPPVTLVVSDVRSSVQTPSTAGSPTDFIARDEPFAVDVDFLAAGIPRAVSENKAVTLVVSVVAGASSFSVASATSITVPKGARSATFSDLELTVAANGVRLLVTATAPIAATKGVVPGLSPSFDVARDFAAFGIDGQAGGTVSREGAGVPCTATPARPTCVDLRLPASPGNGDSAFFSTGVCDASVGCAGGRDVLQVLAAFELPRSSPATLIVKCDKVLCAGGAIRDYAPKVSLAATGLLQPAPPCPSKGVVGAGQDFCVDFVQSKRDGSGDTYLFLLMVRDARMSI